MRCWTIEEKRGAEEGLVRDGPVVPSGNREVSRPADKFRLPSPGRPLVTRRWVACCSCCPPTCIWTKKKKKQNQSSIQMKDGRADGRGKKRGQQTKRAVHIRARGAAVAAGHGIRLFCAAPLWQTLYFLFITVVHSESGPSVVAPPDVRTYIYTKRLGPVLAARPAVKQRDSTFLLVLYIYRNIYIYIYTFCCLLLLFPGGPAINRPVS